MKQTQEIESRLQELKNKYEQANFRMQPKIGSLIQELQWVLGKEITDFD
jgi:ribosomal protein L29